MLGIYFEVIPPTIKIYRYTGGFVVAMFIVECWKQSKVYKGEGLNKLSCVYTTECYFKQSIRADISMNQFATKNIKVQKNIHNIPYFLQEEEIYRKMHIYLFAHAKYVENRSTRN